MEVGQRAPRRGAPLAAGQMIRQRLAALRAAGQAVARAQIQRALAPHALRRLQKHVQARAVDAVLRTRLALPQPRSEMFRLTAHQAGVWDLAARAPEPAPVVEEHFVVRGNGTQRHNVAVYTKDRTIWLIGLEIASGNYIHDERTATPPDPDNPLAGKYAVDGHVDYAIYYTVFTWFALVAAAPMLFNLAVLMLWTAPQAWPGEYKLFLIHASQLLAAWNALDVAALACIVSVTEVGNVLHGTLYQLETSVEDLFQVACGGDAGQCLVITNDLRYGFWITVAAYVRRAGRALRATVAENGSTFRERCCAQR